MSAQSNAQMQEIEGLPVIKFKPDLNAKLVHHLVNFHKVFQIESDPEAQELIKRNTELIMELLLSSPTKPNFLDVAVKVALPESPVVNGVVQKPPVVTVAKDNAVVWKDVLVQKLVDGKVALADAKVKEYANKQVEVTSKKMDELIGALVRSASSFGRFEDKVTFEIDLKSTIQIPSQKIYLRSLTFDISLSFDTSLKSAPFGLIMAGSGLPAGKSCKALVRVTIKNQAGKRDSMRNFSKVFSQTAQGRKLVVYNLLLGDEYENESLGFKKNGKLIVDVVVHADELTEFKQLPKANSHAYNRAYLNWS